MKSNIKQLYKVETQQKKTFYFDSFDGVGSFAKNNKSLNISTCYGEEHTEDGITYYHLIIPEVKININQQTKEANLYIAGPHGHDGDKYTISSYLLSKELKESEENFFIVMDEMYQRSGSMGSYGDTSHHIEEKISGRAYDSFQYGDGWYCEKILLLTKESAQLYDVDRANKIYLSENPEELRAKADARQTLNIFEEQRKKLMDEMNKQKSQMVVLEGQIEALRDESSRCKPRHS